MSQQNEAKIMDFDTVIRNMGLDYELTKNKKRTLCYIERSLDDMVKQKTILKNWIKQKGKNGQEQYKFIPIIVSQSKSTSKSVDENAIIYKAANIAVKKIESKIKNKI
jgi:hypothetical protein